MEILKGFGIALAIFGIILTFGAVGGIECNTMEFIEGMKLAALGLFVMYDGIVLCEYAEKPKSRRRNW